MSKEILTIKTPLPDRLKKDGAVPSLNERVNEVIVENNINPYKPGTKIHDLIEAWITGKGLINLGFGFGIQDSETYITDVNYIE